LLRDIAYHVRNNLWYSRLLKPGGQLDGFFVVQQSYNISCAVIHCSAVLAILKMQVYLRPHLRRQIAFHPVHQLAAHLIAVDLYDFVLAHK
jgi:hypothetical protein